MRVMASDNLMSRLRDAAGDLPDGLDEDAIDRILTEPAQDTLAEALAADAIDAAPVIGDLLALQRIQKADEQGIEYPERPPAIENVLSDIPEPFGTLGDILVAQNTVSYVERETPIPVAALAKQMMDSKTPDMSRLVGQKNTGSGDTY